MDNKESFSKLAEQSEEEFRKQFDPSSESYHKGIPVPVPLNGERIPQSMSTVYPEGFDPNKPEEVIDYGEEYKKVEQERAMYQNLKKSLAKLCPVVQSFFRHEQNFKEKGDPTNEKHVQVHEENLQKQTLTLKAVNHELEEYIPKLENVGEEGKAMAKQLTEIIFESSKKYETKELLTNFNFKVKKLSTQTFSNAQKGLQKLKDIKKQVLAKKKAEDEKKKEQEAPSQ